MGLKVSIPQSKSCWEVDYPIIFGFAMGANPDWMKVSPILIKNRTENSIELKTNCIILKKEDSNTKHPMK